MILATGLALSLCGGPMSILSSTSIVDGPKFQSGRPMAITGLASRLTITMVSTSRPASRA